MSDQIQKYKNIKYLLITLGLIVLIGVIMVYSSSYIYAKEVLGSSSYFFKRQLIYACMGAFLVFLISKTKFHFWYRNSYYIHILCTFLLILTFVPGLGLHLKGAYRWINIKGFILQPGEFIKYTTLFSSIYFFHNYQGMNLKERATYAATLLIPLAILLKQPDFGTFTICVSVMGFVCFLSPFPRKFFYSFLGVGVVGVMGILFLAPYRVQRILVFLDPWKDPRRGGFQIIQSYLAFANGAIFGQGIGNSNEKLFYLPEAHNDFIFSVIGEELGLVGVLLLVSLFIAFIYFGLKIAVKCKNHVVAVTVTTIIFCLGLQAFLNMGVVLGLLPTKGLNLPFVSYGGSSLLTNFLGIGLLMSAAFWDEKLDLNDKVEVFETIEKQLQKRGIIK